MRMNKRGGVGNFVAWIAAAIGIAIVLAGFVLISGMWKTFSDKPAGLVSFEGESEKYFYDYVDKDYRVLNEIKFDVAGGRGVDEVMGEVSYEE